MKFDWKNEIAEPLDGNPGGFAEAPPMISPPVTYFKRFRMEIDLALPLSASTVAPGYSVLAWHESLLDIHAEVKFLSFMDEVDAIEFLLGRMKNTKTNNEFFESMKGKGD